MRLPFISLRSSFRLAEEEAPGVLLNWRLFRSTIDPSGRSVATARPNLLDSRPVNNPIDTLRLRYNGHGV